MISFPHFDMNKKIDVSLKKVLHIWSKLFLVWRKKPHPVPPKTTSLFFTVRCQLEGPMDSKDKQVAVVTQVNSRSLMDREAPSLLEDVGYLDNRGPSDLWLLLHPRRERKQPVVGTWKGGSSVPWLWGWITQPELFMWPSLSSSTV